MTTSPEPETVYDTAEPVTDAQGEVFDPGLHATKPDGTPARKTDGTFRKKRRDAGRGRRTASPTTARASSTATAGAPRALKEQHARHVKAVQDTLAVPTALLSFVDPVDAYCASELTPMWAQALADYAQENPQLAAVLDKLATAGGVSTLLAVTMLTGVQFAHNHGKIPAQYARMMGAKPREEIEEILNLRAAAMQAEVRDAA